MGATSSSVTDNESLLPSSRYIQLPSGSIVTFKRENFQLAIAANDLQTVRVLRPEMSSRQIGVGLEMAVKRGFGDVALYLIQFAPELYQGRAIVAASRTFPELAVALIQRTSDEVIRDGLTVTAVEHQVAAHRLMGDEATRRNILC